MDISEVEVGMKVVVADPRLNCGSPEDHPFTHSNPRTPFGQLAVVAIVQDPEKHPGKLIGLCLKGPHDGAHELDGLVPEKHGWWTRPEYLQTPEQHAEHKKNAEQWDAKKAAAKKVYDAFLKEK